MPTKYNESLRHYLNVRVVVGWRWLVEVGRQRGAGEGRRVTGTVTEDVVGRGEDGVIGGEVVGAGSV